MHGVNWHTKVMGMALLVASCKPTPPPFALADVRDLPDHFPAYVEPEENPLNKAKWELGRHLFFDERLGADGKLSCASCHNPAVGMADSLTTTPGAFDVDGFRNAPALVNLAWQPRYHREGGVPTLESQVLAPVQESNEFNRNLIELVDQLSMDDQYQAWSNEGFQRPFDAYVMTRSLAAFQRTLISGGSPYDRWLQGEVSALSQAATRGRVLFDALECASCHAGVFLSDFATHNTGLYESYLDPGAYRLTFDSADVGAFKTPSLRNVELTAPYMFDGSLPTLESVIEHYVSGGSGHFNQDVRVRPRDISSQDRRDLVAFLKSFTDNEFVIWSEGLRP